MNIKQGEHCLILGASGSGKTTLLHIIASLLKPTEGTVHIADTPIYELKNDDLDKFRGKILVLFSKTSPP